MPIAALSENTVRQLGSSLVITSPVQLLKELLENAIDSGAICIEILVSQNTVDKLEVRDNGHGIHPDDLVFLGRPGHTSKLKSLNELNALGGNTLGFRGVALASANSLADVSVTSKVSSEPVATVVSLAKGGGIGTQRHVGAPVGTTICVTALFKSLPVRRQVAIKDAAKNLAQMKELLQAYALTRPWLRLRFTVSKAPSLSWSYAPAKGGNVTEAALKLFGTGLASQCTFETFPSMKSEASAEPTNTLLFEALLPRSGADPQKISKGAFLSVDSRPVSTKRGTAKKLVSTFRKRIGDLLSPSHSADVPREPFIRLDIRCPPGTYDVNVEPSKDNVLFRDEQHILDQFESFLSLVYPVPEPCGSPRPSIPAVVADHEPPCETLSAVSTNTPSDPLAPRVSPS
jgi:DNA mismatch repair protein MutL